MRQRVTNRPEQIRRHRQPGIERATDAGLITAELAVELDRSRLLRDKLTQGAESSAALRPIRAVAILRAVFDAVSLLLRPPSAAEATAADVGGAQPEGGLARLWEDHLRALFPDGFRGVDFDGVSGRLTVLPTS